MVLDQHVPSVLEYLDGIWGDSYSLALCTSELLVRHQQFVVLFHGVDDGVQMLLSGRNVF